MARRASRKSPPNELQAHLGGVLKDYRREKDISQAELAKRSDTTPERVIAYEKGRRWVTSQTLIRLLEALEVPWDEFFHTVAEACRPAPGDTATASDVYEGVPTASDITDRDFAGFDDMVELEFEKLRLRIPADRLRVDRGPARRRARGRKEQ